MTWLDTARGIEALEVAELDSGLVGALEARARPGPVNFHVPTFKAFATSEISGCGRSAWPAVRRPFRPTRFRSIRCTASPEP